MTNCIFYSLFFALFLNISVGSLKFSQVNRVFMSIYKGLFEASVITIDNAGEPTTPYFDKRLVENYVDSYLKENLSKYSKDYNVDVSYPSDNDDSFCKRDCSRVKIGLTAKINAFYSYEKERVFYIESAENL